jgi:branched-chain amino acid transport system permease protein
VYFVVALSDHTKAWLLYLGLFFMAMVMFAPGGIASLIMMQLPVIAKKQFKRLVPGYCAAGGAGLLVLAALVLTIEMTYKVSVDSATGTAMKLFGIEFDAGTAGPWILAAVLWIIGGWLFNRARKRVAHTWGEIQAELAA